MVVGGAGIEARVQGRQGAGMWRRGVAKGGSEESGTGYTEVMMETRCEVGPLASTSTAPQPPTLAFHSCPPPPPVSSPALGPMGHRASRGSPTPREVTCGHMCSVVEGSVSTTSSTRGPQEREREREREKLVEGQRLDSRQLSQAGPVDTHFAMHSTKRCWLSEKSSSVGHQTRQTEHVRRQWAPFCSTVSGDEDSQIPGNGQYTNIASGVPDPARGLQQRMTRWQLQSRRLTHTRIPPAAW